MLEQLLNGSHVLFQLCELSFEGGFLSSKFEAHLQHVDQSLPWVENPVCSREDLSKVSGLLLCLSLCSAWPSWQALN